MHFSAGLEHNKSPNTGQKCKRKMSHFSWRSVAVQPQERLSHPSDFRQQKRETTLVYDNKQNTFGKPFFSSFGI